MPSAIISLPDCLDHLLLPPSWTRRMPVMVNLFLKAAVANRNLGSSSIDATELDRLVVSESVHGGLGNVEASSNMVDGKDVDALALVCELPAGAARRGVPTGYGLGAADVGELWDVALGLPAVPSDQAVLAVGASDGGKRSGGLIVSGVVGDCQMYKRGVRLEKIGGEDEPVTADAAVRRVAMLMRLGSCILAGGGVMGNWGDVNSRG